MTDNGKVVELYRKHRPTKFRDVLGQPEAVSVLEEMLKKNRVPHALLFSGPSGTGKTTLARIMALKLGCDKNYCKEINFAESRGIDTVRDIEQQAEVPPLGGLSKIKYWILDEIHRGTGDSLSALLKILEDPKDHAYFALCTTDPQKLLKTLRTRCTEITLNSFQSHLVEQLIKNVCARENIKIPDEVVEKIAVCSEGSARKALVLLHQVCDLPGTKEMLAAIQKPQTERVAFDLAKVLLWERGVKWDHVRKILADIEEDDWEGVRQLVLKCAITEALKQGGNHARAYLILDCFAEPVYYSGKAGIVRAAYTVFADAK